MNLHSILFYVSIFYGLAGNKFGHYLSIFKTLQVKVLSYNYHSKKIVCKKRLSDCIVTPYTMSRDSESKMYLTLE